MENLLDSSEDRLLQKPVIIVGTPRSGTTLLGEIFKHHPDLGYLDEPRLTWRYGNDRKSDMFHPEDARPDVCAHIRTTFAQTLRLAQRTRLLEKTPSNSLRMGFVERVLPGCKFVHILRNGIESVLSIRFYWENYASGTVPHKMSQRLREINWRRAPIYLKEFLKRIVPQPLSPWIGAPQWGPRIPGLDGLVRDLDLLDVCCLQWRMCVEAACQVGRTLPKERYLECRLEDMSPDLLKAIMRFAELPEADEVFRALEKKFEPKLPAGRAKTADPDDVARIRYWIQPTLDWLGYE